MVVTDRDVERTVILDVSQGDGELPIANKVVHRSAESAASSAEQDRTLSPLQLAQGLT